MKKIDKLKKELREAKDSGIQSWIDEVAEKLDFELSKAEFKRDVKQMVKEILRSGADTIYNSLNYLHGYRNGGLAQLTFNEAIEEIAQASVLGVSFVDSLSEEDKIELYIENNK